MRLWMLLLFVPFVIPATTHAAEFESTWRVEFENVTDPSASFVAGTSTYNIGSGQQFRANVFVNSSQSFDGLNLTFGWGSAESQGVEATNLDNSFTMNSVNVDEDGLFDPDGIPAELGGFRQSGDVDTGLRPYGYYLTLFKMDGTIAANTDIKIASFLLTNNLAHGGSGSLVIWDAGQGIGWTSQVADHDLNYSRPGGSQSYNINSVPEPGSLMAMGCAGMGVLFGMRRQRRKG
ncbi:MAG: PEP-CTERM sorting domain-containing protein [Armatimonadota bacterium]